MSDKKIPISEFCCIPLNSSLHFFHKPTGVFWDRTAVNIACGLMLIDGRVVSAASWLKQQKLHFPISDFEYIPRDHTRACFRHKPTNTFWQPATVDWKVSPVLENGKRIKASVWLKQQADRKKKS